MSQTYFYPPGYAIATNPSVGPNGSPIPTSSTEIGGKNGSGNLTPVSVDANGNLNVNVINQFVPTKFDEVDLTYVPSGNGAGQVATAVYKLSSVAVATLTMSYNASNQLISVIKS